MGLMVAFGMQVSLGRRGTGRGWGKELVLRIGVLDGKDLRIKMLMESYWVGVRDGAKNEDLEGKC